MIRNLKERSKKILLKFLSIEYKIDIIKSISINSQKFMNLIISSSKSNKIEIIRKKETILSEKNDA